MTLHCWVPLPEKIQWECQQCGRCCTSWDVEIWVEEFQKFKLLPPPCPHWGPSHAAECTVYDQPGRRSKMCINYPFVLRDGMYLEVDAACDGIGHGEVWDRDEIAEALNRGITMSEVRKQRYDRYNTEMLRGFAEDSEKK